MFSSSGGEGGRRQLAGADGSRRRQGQTAEGSILHLSFLIFDLLFLGGESSQQNF